MALVPSQPQLVPLTITSLTGFIKLSDKTEFFVSVDYATTPPVITLDDDLREKLDSYQAKLSDIVEQSKNAVQFIESLVSLAEQVVVNPITDRKHLLTLIKQVANLPPASVKSIDQDFKQIILQHVDASEREHFITIQLDSSLPVISCDLPCELAFPLESSWSCQEILRVFQETVEQYQVLWNVLDEIDGTCWVVEPEPFTRNALHRRVVLKEDVSLVVTLDPAQPTSLPRCRFLGSAKSIQPLQNLLDEKADQWDPEVGVVENLSSLLDLELPGKPDSDGSAVSIECGVCYCYDMEGQIPEISCNNETCRQLFHVECLVEWFRGLPNVRQSFGTVFGECPYCSKSMHVQAVL